MDGYTSAYNFFSCNHECSHTTAKPSPPQNLTVQKYFDNPNISLVVSWDAQDDVNRYIISINSTNANIIMTTFETNMTIEVEYNPLLQLSLTAINCAGRNEVTTDIVFSKCIYMCMGGKSSYTPLRIVIKVTEPL